MPVPAQLLHTRARELHILVKVPRSSALLEPHSQVQRALHNLGQLAELLLPQLDR
jgi:hypothetical protein